MLLILKILFSVIILQNDKWILYIANNATDGEIINYCGIINYCELYMQGRISCTIALP